MIDNSSIFDRFMKFGRAKYGDRHGWKKTFAEALGITPQALNTIIQRESFGISIQEKLRDLGCDVEWLMTGIKKENNMNFETISLVKIPVYQFNRSGGGNMVIREKESDYIVTQQTDDETLFAVIVKGNNMAPEINEGNIVVLSKKQERKTGDICLVIFQDDHAGIYRVYDNDQRFTLTSINEKQYPPANHKKSEIKFIYKVIQKITNY